MMQLSGNQCQRHQHQDLVCFCICLRGPWYAQPPPIALSSTDSWMETCIKKRKTKKGMSGAHGSQSKENPFEEIERFLKQPWLRREDCPNPIPWWGVSVFDLLFDNSE